MLICDDIHFHFDQKLCDVTILWKSTKVWEKKIRSSSTSYFLENFRENNAFIAILIFYLVVECNNTKLRTIIEHQNMECPLFSELAFSYTIINHFCVWQDAWKMITLKKLGKYLDISFLLSLIPNFAHLSKNNSQIRIVLALSEFDLFTSFAAFLNSNYNSLLGKVK